MKKGYGRKTTAYMANTVVFQLNNQFKDDDICKI